MFEVEARVFQIVGLIEKITKQEGPDHVMTLLGIMFDSTTNIFLILSSKMDEILSLIDSVLDMDEKGGVISFWTPL